jgi:hypothetical protein
MDFTRRQGVLAYFKYRIRDGGIAIHFTKVIVSQSGSDQSLAIILGIEIILVEGALGGFFHKPFLQIDQVLVLLSGNSRQKHELEDIFRFVARFLRQSVSANNSASGVGKAGGES